MLKHTVSPSLCSCDVNEPYSQKLTPKLQNQHFRFLSITEIDLLKDTHPILFCHAESLSCMKRQRICAWKARVHLWVTESIVGGQFKDHAHTLVSKNKLAENILWPTNLPELQMGYSREPNFCKSMRGLSRDFLTAKRDTQRRVIGQQFVIFKSVSGAKETTTLPFQCTSRRSAE